MRGLEFLCGSVLLLGACVAPAGGKSPNMAAWNVDERLALPPPPSPGDEAGETTVEVHPRGASLVALEPRRELCRAAPKCRVELPRGTTQLGVWSGAPEGEPEATLALVLDSRPARIDVTQPKTALSWTGAALTAVGFLSAVLGGVGKEAGGNETSDVFLYGGIAMAATGITLGVVYWTGHRGRVEIAPLPPSAAQPAPAP